MIQSLFPELLISLTTHSEFQDDTWVKWHVPVNLKELAKVKHMRMFLSFSNLFILRAVTACWLSIFYTEQFAWEIKNQIAEQVSIE